MFGFLVNWLVFLLLLKFLSALFICSLILIACNMGTIHIPGALRCDPFGWPKIQAVIRHIRKFELFSFSFLIHPHYCLIACTFFVDVAVRLTCCFSLFRAVNIFHSFSSFISLFILAFSVQFFLVSPPLSALSLFAELVIAEHLLVFYTRFLFGVHWRWLWRICFAM